MNRQFDQHPAALGLTEIRRRAVAQVVIEEIIALGLVPENRLDPLRRLADARLATHKAAAAEARRRYFAQEAGRAQQPARRASVIFTSQPLPERPMKQDPRRGWLRRFLGRLL